MYMMRLSMCRHLDHSAMSMKMVVLPWFRLTTVLVRLLLRAWAAMSRCNWEYCFLRVPSVWRTPLCHIDPNSTGHSQSWRMRSCSSWERSRSWRLNVTAGHQRSSSITRIRATLEPEVPSVQHIASEMSSAMAPEARLIQEDW